MKTLKICFCKKEKTALFVVVFAVSYFKEVNFKLYRDDVECVSAGVEAPQHPIAWY